MNNFTCSWHVDAEFQGWAFTRGAGCFQSSLERRAEPPNTVFKLQREALSTLVYFNSNFYVRNTTWNADTGERRVRENTWHMINKSPPPSRPPAGRLRFLQRARTHTFPKSCEMRVLAPEYSTLSGHNKSAQTHLRQQHRVDPTSAELLEITSLTLRGAPLLLRDQRDQSVSLLLKCVS